MTVDFFLYFCILMLCYVLFCLDTPLLAPCFLNGLPRSSDDSHSFTLDPDFHRVEEDVSTCEGTNSTIDGSSIAASCEEHPPFTPPVSVFFWCYVLWTLCVSDTRLPCHDLREEASISTERTCIRRLAGSVSEAT